MSDFLFHRSLFRLATALAAIACGVVTAARAADAEVDLLAELELAAREAGVDLDLPEWDVSSDLEIGIGTNDNVLLEAFDPDASGFVRAVGTVLAWRRPSHGLEWMGFLDASHSRFFSADTDDATLVVGRAEGRWRPDSAWRAALAVQGIYQDEVIDASSLENDYGSVHAQLGSVALLPSAEWDFAPAWTLALKPALRRFDYRAPLDDFTETEGELAFTRDMGRLGRFVLAGKAMERAYDDRPKAGPAGRPIYGTLLRVRQAGGEWRHEVAGGGERPWKSRLRLSRLENTDNGSGYYDYARTGIDWFGAIETDHWRFDADLSWRRYEYRVQLAGFGTNPPRRMREEWRVLLRTERKVRETLVAFVEAEYVNSDSNDLFVVYDNTILTLGVRWSP